MNLYIIRHGETDWNRLKRMQGQTDIPLNDYGRELARVTYEGMKDIHMDYVFSSPLSRAVETAKIVLGDAAPNIVTDNRLCEVSFGSCEGLYPDERPESFNDFFYAPDKYVPTGDGETVKDLCNRTRSFIEDIILPLAVKEPEANVFISGHGAMNKSILLYFKGLELKDLWKGPFTLNCSVNLIKIDRSGKNWELVYENKVFYESESVDLMK